ncbi:hypothetical protein [Nocardia farcinica]|uniref:hypothetical protein n=1 Tax=Nocardia farcinica TaxID=37329 RepID=UPI0018953BCB|nr:hypothetical protein [Nocardia farcinica]MBF6411040.1 hypothetical protein [Nocardia farcinica]
MARLNSYVHCYKGHEVHVFGPGDDVPEWARKQITRPELWDEAPQVTVDGETSDPADGPPPQGGAGASRQRWADYAASNGVQVQDDWKREDIIDACEKAGVPV